MKPLTSCCCFDLKTGGIYTGVALIIFAILGVGGSTNVSYGGHKFGGQNVFGTILFIAIEALWIYGIKENKIKYMLPSVVMMCISSVIFVIIAFVVLIACIVAPGSFPVNQSQGTGPLIAVLIFVAVLILAFAALICYLTAVKYYLYKQMQSENQTLPTTTTTTTTANVPAYPPTNDGAIYKLPA